MMLMPVSLRISIIVSVFRSFKNRSTLLGFHCQQLAR
jgi:hypothetical protein